MDHMKVNDWTNKQNTRGLEGIPKYPILSILLSYFNKNSFFNYLSLRISR